MHRKIRQGLHRATLFIEGLENRILLAFAHPSILNTQADFDRMATKVNAGAQPWTMGYNALVSDGYSQAGWTPRPLATVIRGGTGQNFTQMVIDMQRAYQTAVRWKVSGSTLYADQAVQILNAWSSTHTVLTGNADRFLASGLYGFGWAAAADIMRSYPGWAAADVTTFQNYLLNVYYPLQDDFLYGGDDGVSHNGAAITNYWANWDLANIEGMMALGIFCDRQDIYDRAVNYLYTGGGNGALDKAAYYLHPGNLMQWQESGRDQGHTTLGMGLFGHIAQMTWNQGQDLFAYNNYQFLAAAEYIAKYNLGFDVPYQTYMWGTGQSGNWQQQTTLGSGSRGNGRPVYELISNHYVQRLGMAAPYSAQRVLNLRPEWRGNGDEFGFGTLTYALDGFAAPQPPRGLTAAEKGAGNIQLDWFGGSNVTSYNVYRATSIGGTYTPVASGINDLLTYTDRDLPEGVYYYKVTGVSGATETVASSVVSATSSSSLQAQLLFNESGGTTASDASGNGHAGVLNNGASWTAGKSGNAVWLDGTNDYVSLPSGVIADASDFTISTWLYLNSAATWSRIFDFGDDRGHWMFLTPRNGNGVIEFATSTVYGYNKQWITGTSALPTNQWVHVAVTLSDHVGTLYVNGVAVGSNPGMDFPPTQIGATPNNWIGRSQYGSDPYLYGRVDDFRIYRGALKAGEIYTQATGLAAPAVPAAPAALSAAALVGNAINLSWSDVSGATGGYTIKRATADGGPYTPITTMYSGTSYSDTGRAAGTTYYYVVAANNNGGESANSPQASAVALPPMPGVPANLIAKASSATGITLTWSAASNSAGYTVKRSLTSGGPYTTIATGITTTSYTNSGLTTGTTYYYVVSAGNASGESADSYEAGATPSALYLQLKFDETAGSTAPDTSGNASDGTLVNGPLWTSGRANSAVALDGIDDYIGLQNGLMNGLASCTIAAWVNLDTLSTWSRIFDFGAGTSSYMFLTPRNGNNGNLRFGISTSGYGAEQQINSSISLPTGSWRHVAVTLNGSTGILYVSGVEVGRNSAMTLGPAALGSLTQNYIGKSQFSGDAYLDGRVDDFRIYSQALSAAQINAMATASLPAAPASLTATAVIGNRIELSWAAVAGAAGYNVLRGTISGGPYTTIATQVVGTSYADVALVGDASYFYVVTAETAGGDSPYSPQASAVALPPLPQPVSDLTAQPATTAAVALSWSSAADAATYSVKRSATSGGPYSTVVTGITGTSYTDGGLTNGVTYYYVISSANSSGQSDDSDEAVATPTDLYTRLRFDETAGTTALDSSSHDLNGSLVNGAAWSASGRVGRAVDLDGTNDYISLPSGILSSLTTTTFAAWVYLDAVSDWARVFDFGSSTSVNLFLTAKAGSVARFAITTGGGSGEQQINGTSTLPIGTWTHVAVTLNGSVGILFVNGVEAGRNSGMTLNPSSLGSTSLNYLGRSQYGSDPYLNGRIDDFRIYSRALSAGEVSSLAATIAAPATPGTLNATAGHGQVSLSWPSAAGATSYTLKRSRTSGGAYDVVAVGLTSTNYLDQAVSNGTTYYYVVSAANLLDASGNSVEASATPQQVISASVVSASHLYESSPSTLSFVFDADVAGRFSISSLSIDPLPAGAAVSPTGFNYDAATRTAAFALPTPLPDGNYRARLSASGILPADYTLEFFVLAGDANRDRVVDITDLGILATNWQGAGKTFSQGDFNYDGVVDITDLGILATNWQKTLAPPVPELAIASSSAPAPAQAGSQPASRPATKTTRRTGLVQDVLG